MKKLKKYDKQVATRISEEDYEILAEYALTERLNIADVLRNLIFDKIEQLKID